MVEKKRGVAFLWLILVSVISFTAGAASPSECELRASPKAAVLSRLVQIGLQENFITQDDIQEFIASSEFYNPYTRFAKSVDSVSLKNGFERTSRSLTLAEITELKKSLKAFVQQTNMHEQDIAVARKETEQILAPKVLRQLKVPGYMNRNSPLDLTWRNGRPIFLARMDETKRGSERTMAVILDPFNSRVTNRVTGIPRTSGTGNPKGNFEFFERKGIPYAVDFAQNFFVDLNRNQNAAHSVFRTSYRKDLDFFQGAVVKGADFAKVVTNVGYGKYANQLIALDLLSPRSEPKVLRSSVAMVNHPPEVFYIGEKTYVAYLSNTAIHIYDAGADSMLAPIKANAGGYSENRAVIYSSDGVDYIAFAEIVNRSKSRIRIVNLATQKSMTVKGDFTHPQNFGSVRIADTPYLYFFDCNELVFLNLRTLNREIISTEISTRPSRFTWNARDFLVWAASGNLHILDFDSGAVIDIANILPENAYQIVPFEFRGEVYALVAVSNELPYLLQLTGREGKAAP